MSQATIGNSGTIVYLETELVRTAIRTDNGPGVSSVHWRLPAGAGTLEIPGSSATVRNPDWFGALRADGCEVIDITPAGGGVPAAPMPSKPFPAASRENPPERGSGFQAADSSPVTCRVRVLVYAVDRAAYYVPRGNGGTAEISWGVSPPSRAGCFPPAAAGGLDCSSSRGPKIVGTRRREYRSPGGVQI